MNNREKDITDKVSFQRLDKALPACFNLVKQ